MELSTQTTQKAHEDLKEVLATIRKGLEPGDQQHCKNCKKALAQLDQIQAVLMSTMPMLVRSFTECLQYDAGTMDAHHGHHAQPDENIAAAPLTATFKRPKTK